MLGQYIVIEGLDLAGKDTLISEIEKEYIANGRDYLLVREPNDLNEEMKDIRQIIKENKFPKSTQIEMLIYQRTYLLREHIIPTLKKGIDVISNRNFLTSCSYQQSPSFSVQDIFNMNIRIRIEGHPDRRWTIPDKLVFLDIDHATYKERMLKRIGELDVQDVITEQEEVFVLRKDNYHKAIELLSTHGLGFEDIIVNPPSIGELMRRLWIK